jgi:hypothetical protein
MINGMPEPSLLRFLLNNTPHFVDFRFFDLLDLNDDLAWIPLWNDWKIEVLKPMLFFVTLQ